MLDIKFIRENFELIEKKNRLRDQYIDKKLQESLKQDDLRRNYVKERDELNHKKKSVSEEIRKLKKEKDKSYC